MATIEVRGYVQKPQAKTSKGGKEYCQYNLGVKQKDKRNGEEKVTWANFQVTDFNNASPPQERAFATVKGYLKVREAEVNGQKRTFLEINATEVEVAEPFNDAAEPPASAAPKSAKATEPDPWEE